MLGPTLVVLRRQLENLSPGLQRALTAYQRLDLTGVAVPPARLLAPKMPQRRLSPAELDALVVSYDAGATLAELSAQSGVHRHALARQLRARGVRMHRTTPDSGELDQMARLYRSGWTIQRIATYLGYGYGTIRRGLTRAGVQLRDRQGNEKS